MIDSLRSRYSQRISSVQDREHKWLSRGTLDGRKKRAIGYQAARGAGFFAKATSVTRHRHGHL